MREQQFQGPLLEHFRRRGFTYCCCELPFFRKSIDVFAYHPGRRIAVSVEMKVKNWRRAFRQALVYQLCSDYVYVLLPEEYAHRADIGLFREHEVGLLTISGVRSGGGPSVAELVEPRRSRARDRKLRRRQIDKAKRNTK